MPRLDASILQAALMGYQHQLGDLKARIADIQRRLGGRTAAAPIIADRAKPKRVMSAAAIARIRAAQKKRWAAFRKQHPKKTAAKTRAKRTMSPERKAALAENLKKARAARAAKKVAV